MTDFIKKNSSVVVVTLLLAIILLPSTMAFTSDLQQYTSGITSEISKRSYSIMEFLDPESMLMQIGTPLFKTVTFLVSAVQFFRMVTDYIPGLRELLGVFGLGGLSQLQMIGHMPTEMGTAREQRRMDHLDHQVQSAIAKNQADYERK